MTDALRAGMAQLVAARTAQLVDTCAVTRPFSSEQTPALDAAGNPAAGPDAPTVYTGPCVLARFKSTGVRASITPTPTDLAGVPEPRTLKVPHTADLRPGDLVTMTGCVFSPHLAGQRFVVLHEDPRTFATFRAFTVRGNSWQTGT